MKILTVNLHNDVFGAGRAAYRLHSAFVRENRHEARMLVGIRQLPDATVTEIFKGQMKKFRFQAGIKLEQWPMRRYQPDERYFFSPDGVGNGVHKHIQSQDADVVHIHWINHNFMTLSELLKINKPILLSCHDMWYFTGGCHYDEECGRFTTGCGLCPALSSSKINDLSSKGYRKRASIYRQLGDRLTIIGLSGWMYDSAVKSGLFVNNRVVHLPNGIDTTFFKPVDKKLARQILNLPQDKPLILFGAVDATSDIRKGYHHLKEALVQLDRNAQLIIFGDERNTTKRIDGDHFIEHHTGHVKDEATLILLYSAADVTVVPSRQENLPNVIMESMACGTPVVAFNVGGNSDMVVHGENGFLATPFDSKEMAHGIASIIENGEVAQRYGHNARQKIVNQFDDQLVSQQYISLYQSLINKKS